MDLNTNPYAPPDLSSAEIQRRRPASSGGINLILFPLTALAGLAVAVALAWVLAAVFAAGMYYILIVPMVAAGILATAVYFSVRLGQCRNRWLGLALGVICGCVLYLGYFHFDLIRQAGPGAAWRIDALPGYIAFRMQNDVSRDMHQPEGKESKPLWALNLVMFCVEFGFILWITSVVGFRAASRAFDEARGRWGTASYTTILFGQSQILEAGRQAGRLSESLQQVTPVSLQLNTPHCMLVLERFEANESEQPRAFLSAYEIKMPGQSPAFNELLYLKPVAIRQLELSAAELAACEPLFAKRG
jgi:hypothetical protein